MTPAQIIQILESCKANGVISFKFGGLEVKLGVESVPTSLQTVGYMTPYVNPIQSGQWVNGSQQQPLVSATDPENVSLKPIKNDTFPNPISPEEEVEIKHKVDELSSVMKLSDQELIDRMFPLPEDETQGVA